MATTEVIILLFFIFSSIGINFTSGAIGESLQDAFSNGNINFSKADNESRSLFENVLATNDDIAKMTITPEMVNAQGTINTGDLANAGVNVEQWMYDNQNNVNLVSDGYAYQLGNFTFKSLNFLDGQSCVDSGFICDGPWESFDQPFSCVGVYNPDGTLFGSHVHARAFGAPGTTQALTINDIQVNFSRDYVIVTVYYTILYFKNGVSYTYNGQGDVYISYGAWGDFDDSVQAIPGDLVDAAVGSVAIGGQVYDLNSDGSVTIDGNTYPINPDGSITVDGVKYYPQLNPAAYDDTALRNLLNQILQRLDQIENELTFDDTVADDVAAPAISYDGTMSELLYNTPKWAQVFPFCLPWDFVRGVKLLSADPVAPKFEIPFEIPAFGQFPGYKDKIVLDFAEYDKYFVVVRWFSTVFFIAGLIFISFKIVKGVR